jgi:hypothetical protein
MSTIAFLYATVLLGQLLAADVETQHAFDITLPVKPNVELILHSRLRTQPGGLGLYQVRAGPIVSWKIGTRAALLGGYYYTQHEQEIDNDFIGGHRPFAGAEVSLVERRRFSLDQRLLAERFLSDATDDFHRYRFRTRLSAEGPVAPYASYELFLDASGWRSARYSTGIRWTVIRAVQIDFGYFFEQRRPNVGPDRHMWLTSLHLTRASRRADPEL